MNILEDRQALFEGDRLIFDWKPQNLVHQHLRYINNLHIEENNEYAENQFSENSSIKEENQNSVCDLMEVAISRERGDSNYMSTDRYNSVDNHFEGKKQILLVDDQEFNLNAMEIILQYKLNVKTEETCVRATSGKQALELIKKDAKTHKN